MEAVSEAVTEPADADATMRRAIYESASAIEASLRVVQAMKIEEAEVLGHKGRVIMLSEASFTEWQQAVKALHGAAVCCSKALYGSASKTQQGGSIEVPVETLGYRPRSSSPPQHRGMPPGAWPPPPPLWVSDQPPPPLGFRAPPAFGSLTITAQGLAHIPPIARSTSAPML